MQVQSNLEIKYCYIFSNENLTQQHIEDIFGSVDELNDTAQSALEELKLDQLDNSKWFSDMESKLGPAIIAEVTAMDGEILAYRKIEPSEISVE